MRNIRIFETTLRDGEQAPGCSMHLSEKIEVAHALEKLRVDTMEAGFAVISEGDFQAVSTIAKRIKDAQVASLARSVKKDIDAAYEALKDAAAPPRIHMFLATSDLHMQYKLKMSREKVLQTITESVSYAKKLLSDIEFSAEDATRSDPEFLVKAVEAAILAGASTINIPDTVGYTTPAEMFERIKYLMSNVRGIENVTLSVHCHNDLGTATANSLAAVAAGAGQVECTLNGFGERAGNAALEEVVMALSTRKSLYNAASRVDTTQIYRSSKLVYNLLGLSVPLNKAIVGVNAFAHEAGIHQHGVLANRETYEIMTPESIGLVKNKMVLGKHSGRHAVEDRLSQLGYSLNKEELDTLFDKFKSLADKKKNITDHDLEALIGHKTAEIVSGYKLESFIVYSGNKVTGNAVVRLSDGKRSYEEVSLGDGPVDAAFKAVDRIIKQAPKHSLEDYSIHSVTEGKDALGEVVVKLRCGDEVITGRGLSTDIIEASISAYVNGINKLL